MSHPPDPHLQLASSYIQLKQFRLAVKTLKTLLKQQPHHLFAYVGLIETFVYQKKIKKAQKICSLALNHHPGALELIVLQIKIYQVKDAQDMAFQLLQTYLKNEPTSSIMHMALGEYYLQYNELYSAIEAFTQAKVLDETNAEAHLALSHAYQACGELDKSLNAYQRAIELSPDLGPAVNIDDFDKIWDKIQMELSSDAMNAVEALLESNPEELS